MRHRRPRRAGSPRSPNPAPASCPTGGEELDASGLHAFPAFFDPHVHLRTPGQEYREDIESGTRAAAAGGFCGIVAMANTDPVVDDPAIVAALRERAETEAVVPTGFVATVTRGMNGRELSEMAALREAGAVGFSDDGLPVTDAGVMRRALQYQHLVGGTILLHEEDPALSGDGAMGEGAVSAALGARRRPRRLGVDDDRSRRRPLPLRGCSRPRPAPLRPGLGRGGGSCQAGRARS